MGIRNSSESIPAAHRIRFVADRLLVDGLGFVVVLAGEEVGKVQNGLRLGVLIQPSAEAVYRQGDAVSIGVGNVIATGGLGADGDDVNLTGSGDTPPGPPDPDLDL